MIIAPDRISRRRSGASAHQIASLLGFFCRKNYQHCRDYCNSAFALCWMCDPFTRLRRHRSLLQHLSRCNCLILKSKTLWNPEFWIRLRRKSQPTRRNRPNDSIVVFFLTSRSWQRNIYIIFCGRVRRDSWIHRTFQICCSFRMVVPKYIVLIIIETGRWVQTFVSATARLNLSSTWKFCFPVRLPIASVT